MSDRNVQGELFFDQGDQLGYDSYQANLENRKAELGSKLGLPIGKRVVVELRRIAGEHEGILELASAAVGKADNLPELKIGKLIFRRSDVSSIRVLEQTEENRGPDNTTLHERRSTAESAESEAIRIARKDVSGEP